MKTMKSKADANLAQELYEIIQARRELDKREREIKDYFKALGDQPLQVGGYLIIQKEAVTSSLDRVKLAAENGDEFVAKYLKITTYTRLEIIKEKK